MAKRWIDESGPPGLNRLAGFLESTFNWPAAVPAYYSIVASFEREANESSPYVPFPIENDRHSVAFQESR